jgi:hypothetical protein
MKLAGVLVNRALVNRALIYGALAGAIACVPMPCRAESACAAVAVETKVVAERGEFTLADLLRPDACPQLRRMAAHVSLGSVPRAGSQRVFDGRQIRRLFEALPGEGLSAEQKSGLQIPDRIVVERSGRVKSCAEIARFLTSAAAPEETAASGVWQKSVDCAAARGIPEDASLELTKTAWHASLSRWEFSLRCARPEDCVPFLVWAPAEKNLSLRMASTPGAAAEASPAGAGGSARLIKPGQTAMLTWDQAGIRVVLSVTCLDAGALGQTVRVRFKNGAGILRAEVVGAGALRARL